MTNAGNEAVGDHAPGSTSAGALLLGLRLAVLGAFLVHCPRRDLLGLVLRSAALLVRLLDVLVLALALVAPCFLRHQSPPGANRESRNVATAPQWAQRATD